MNILKYILRYLTLFGLFFLLILLTKFYGNYSTVIHFFLFVIPLVVILIIVNLLILYRFERKRNNIKVLKMTISFLLLLCGLNLLIGYIDNNKTVVMIMTQQNDLRTSELFLYKNLSYKITTLYPHGTTNYSGKYTLENNILELKDSDIEDKTKNRFTNKYKLNKLTNQFESTKSDFEKLEIVK